jgi:hypothetical protein
MTPIQKMRHMSRAQIKQAHVMYVLACGHVVLSSPNLVSSKLDIWCPVDNLEQKVKGVHKYEWRAHCRECTYTRWCGTSELLANQLVSSHIHATYHRAAKAEYVVNPSAVEELIRLTKMKAI